MWQQPSQPCGTSAFAAFSSWGPEALFVGPDPLFNTERAQLVTLAARHALPVSYFSAIMLKAAA
jgi:hypothetical protein